MVKNSNTVGLNCFPDIDNVTALPRTIPLQEIEKVIDTSYEKIVDLISKMFASSGQTMRLQKNRSKVFHFANELKKKLEINSDGTYGNNIETYGDLRRTGKRVHKTIRDSVTVGHKRFKDRRIDPTVSKLIRDEYEELSKWYIQEIAASQSENPTLIASPLEVVKEEIIEPEHIVAPITNAVEIRKSAERVVVDAMNSEAEMNKTEFPQPIHGYWDLDHLVESQKIEAPEDELPSWVRSLSESEANRLLILLSETGSTRNETTSLDEFFSQTNTDFSRNETTRYRVVRNIVNNTEKSILYIRKWLERHICDGFVEQSGVYVQKSSYLRVQEQKQLMKPNLQRIVQHHFSRTGKPVHERSLIDIGTWDGEMPKALQKSFGKMIGVEPNEKRFDQLLLNPTPNLNAINTDIQTILDNKELYDLHSDVMLFSHVLYFLQQKDTDVESLKWAHEQLHENGIAIIILNDSELQGASRAHMRNKFGVRESAGTPYFYETFFKKQGIETRMMQPSLHIKAHTKEGQVAMRDIMRFMLPGEKRHDQAALDRYQEFIQENNGTLKHTLNILVAYKNAESAPLRTLPKTTTLPFSKPLVQNNGKTKRRESNTRTVNEVQTIIPLNKGVETLTPFEIVDFVEKILEISWGDEYKTRELLENTEVSWSIFRMWRAKLSAYKIAADVLEHINDSDCIPQDVQINADALTIILKSIEGQHESKKEFKATLRRIGLYSRYYSKNYKPKPKREQEPVYEHQEFDTSHEEVEPYTETEASSEPDTMHTANNHVKDAKDTPDVKLSPLELFIDSRGKMIQEIEQGGVISVAGILELRSHLIRTLEANSLD